MFNLYGIGTFTGRGGSSNWTPQSSALFKRMTVQPTADRKTAVDTVIKALIDAGVWDKLDVLYVFAGFDQQVSLLNWKGDIYNATVVGSMSFVSNESIQNLDGNNYLRTHYNPSEVSNNYKLNSCSAGIWCRTDDSNGAPEDCGVWTTRTSEEGSTHIQLYNYGTPVININGAGDFRTSGGNTGVFLTWSLIEGNARMFKDGVFASQSVITPVRIPNGEILVSCINYLYNGGPDINPFAISTRKYSAFFAGGGLTDQQQATLYTTLNSYYNDINQIAESETFDTYLMAGQSNMQGLGESAYNIAPYNLTTGQRKIYNWQHHQWQSLSPLLNGMGILVGGYFGLESSFLYQMSEYKNKPIYAIKYAIGGSSLYQEAEGNDWNVNSADELYQQFLDLIDEVQAATLAQQKKLKIKGFIWVQGENDAGDIKADAYADNLSAFMTGVLAKANGINNTNGFPVQAVAIVIGKITGTGSRKETVQIAGSNWCTANGGYFIDTDTYPLRGDPDFVHIRGDGLVQYGVDIFNAVKDL